MKRVPTLLLLFLIALPSLASTRTWTGTSSNLWSVPANWGGTAPVAGDDLVFPAGASNLATSNDFPAGTSFNSLTFSGAASYSIAGNAFAIGAGGVTNNATSLAINVAVTLGATQTWLNSGTNMTFFHVNLNGQSLTLSSTSGAPAINGIISGSGTITKSGSGLWIFNGSNTFSGQLLITAGTLLANSVNAFGTADDTAANGTIVSSGAQLQIVAGFTYPTEQITVNGSGIGGSGGGIAVTSSGNVTLNGTVVLGTSVGMNAVGSSITFSGPITGSGQLGMSGNGVFVLNNAGNTFTGGVKWGVGGSNDSTLTSNVNNALPSSLTMNIPTPATFNLQSKTQTLVSLTGTGTVVLGSGTPGTLTITNPSFVSFDGSLGGTGNVTVTGGSNYTLTGANAFTGTFTNAGGLTAFSGGTMTAPIVQSSGTLGISSGATTAAVTINGGSLFPGVGGSGVGFTGNLALVAGAAYNEIIVGTSSGLYGLLHVTGTVNLGGAKFALSGSGSGVVNGTQLKIIDNDGSDPITGTFNGLPQGATISGGPGGFNYVISYTGGDGNDVVLTAVSSGLATTSVTLSGSPNPAPFGTSVTFTAHVTSGTPGTPTGTVTFLDNGTSIGTGAVNGVGLATLSTSSLTAGSHLMTASYSGDSTFSGSTSGPASQSVTATSATTVTSSLNPSAPGASVTFTAHVTGAAPTGVVTFLDGASTLGTGAIAGGAATFATSSLASGPHNITASYPGDTSNAPSVSPIVVQNVSAAAATAGVPALDGRMLAILAAVLALVATKVMKG